MKEINLTVNIDEANLILEALGNLPFVRVFALIGKIQEQSSQQINKENRSTEVKQPENSNSDLSDQHNE
jgi:hypothetical protein